MHISYNKDVIIGENIRMKLKGLRGDKPCFAIHAPKHLPITVRDLSQGHACDYSGASASSIMGQDFQLASHNTKDGWREIVCDPDQFLLIGDVEIELSDVTGRAKSDSLTVIFEVTDKPQEVVVKTVSKNYAPNTDNNQPRYGNYGYRYTRS